MKKLVREKLYENLSDKMSPDQFTDWFYNLYEDPQYEDIDWPIVVDTLTNDEDSTNEEIKEYLSNKICPILLNKLLDKRRYFLDFRYSQHINI